MEIVKDGEDRVVRIFSPREWIALGTDWQSRLFWSSENPDQEIIHLHSPRYWNVRLSVDKKGKASLLPGTTVHAHSPRAIKLYEEALLALGVQGTEVLHSKRWKTCLEIPATSASPTPLEATVKVQKLNLENWNKSLLEEMTFLAQNAFARMGRQIPPTHLIQSWMAESFCQANVSFFGAFIDGKIRAFLATDQGKLILWGALNPRRDQGVLRILATFAQANDLTPTIGLDPQTEWPSLNPFAKIKAFVPLRQMQLYLLSTQGPELASTEHYRFEVEPLGRIRVYSLDENQAITGWTSVHTENLRVADWKMQWMLPPQTAALEEDFNLTSIASSFHRIHVLRRHLLVKGFLGIVSSSQVVNGPSLSKWGFIKIHSLLGWKTGISPSR